jgi:hypothetical protein
MSLLPDEPRVRWLSIAMVPIGIVAGLLFVLVLYTTTVLLFPETFVGWPNPVHWVPPSWRAVFWFCNGMRGASC